MTTEWKPSPLKSLEELLTKPILDTMEQLKKQLEADRVALQEFQDRLERSRRPRP